MPFIWERTGWPELTFDAGALISSVTRARLAQGTLVGLLRGMSPGLQDEAELAVGMSDVIATSAIEGEVLTPASVRSSIGRKLGVSRGGLGTADRHVDGLVEVVLDATRNATKPMTEKRLLGWHASLFPTGRSAFSRIAVGAFRDDAAGPMQVVSAALSRSPVVHFEAPPAARVRGEVRNLLQWLEGPGAREDGLLASGLVHLWFLTIHPFDDGNGRIARALADLVLARADSVPHRFWSMSSQLQRERADYYLQLEAAQRGRLDVTGWLAWFVACFTRAIAHSESIVRRVTLAHTFWLEHAAQAPFSERQQRMLRRVLEDEGDVTVKQWARSSKVSLDTAQRDIDDLVGRRILTRNPGGGPRTSYRFAWKPLSAR